MRIYRDDRKPVIWRHIPGLSDYLSVVGEMKAAVDGIIAGTEREQIWTIESQEAYSGRGRFRDLEHYRGGNDVPVIFPTGPGRAGSYTYHGPGVLGVIVMLDLKKRKSHLNPQQCLDAVQDWIANAITSLGLTPIKNLFGQLGVGVDGKLIAPISFNIRTDVTSYGFGFYVNPNLARFSAIIPCGVEGARVTSLADQGLTTTMAEAESALQKAFIPIFGNYSVV